MSNSPRVSFILCRALLEEICNDFQVPAEEVNNNKKRFVSLHDRLDILFQQEEMDEDLIKIIRGIKELGNKGAHLDHLTFSEQIEDEDASSLICIVHYVVERLYIDRYMKNQAEQKLAKLKSKII